MSSLLSQVQGQEEVTYQTKENNKPTRVSAHREAQGKGKRRRSRAPNQFCWLQNSVGASRLDKSTANSDAWYLWSNKSSRKQELILLTCPRLFYFFFFLTLICLLLSSGGSLVITDLIHGVVCIMGPESQRSPRVTCKEAREKDPSLSPPSWLCPLQSCCWFIPRREVSTRIYCLSEQSLCNTTKIKGNEIELSQQNLLNQN